MFHLNIASARRCELDDTYVCKYIYTNPRLAKGRGWCNPLKCFENSENIGTKRHQIWRRLWNIIYTHSIIILGQYDMSDHYVKKHTHTHIAMVETVFFLMHTCWVV